MSYTVMSLNLQLLGVPADVRGHATHTQHLWNRRTHLKARRDPRTAVLRDIHATDYYVTINDFERAYSDCQAVLIAKHIPFWQTTYRTTSPKISISPPITVQLRYCSVAVCTFRSVHIVAYLAGFPFALKIGVQDGVQTHRSQKSLILDPLCQIRIAYSTATRPNQQMPTFEFK